MNKEGFHKYTTDALLTSTLNPFITFMHSSVRYILLCRLPVLHGAYILLFTLVAVPVLFVIGISDCVSTVASQNMVFNCCSNGCSYLWV